MSLEEMTKGAAILQRVVDGYLIAILPEMGRMVTLAHEAIQRAKTGAVPPAGKRP